MMDFSPATRTAARSELDGAAKHLHGRYKVFIAPAHHGTVESWYNDPATPAHKRRNFKTLVKAIMEFDYEAARGNLAPTREPDIVGANAIASCNSQEILSPESVVKAVKWLSFASLSQKQMYRDTFGNIVKPPLFTGARQYDADFRPERMFTKGENMTVGTCRAVVAKEEVHPHSKPHEAACQVISNARTQHDTFFVWKTGQRVASNVLQRAHESTFHGAPWGVYGEGTESNKSQWLSVTQEAFKDGVTDGPAERPFQNFNDNFCHALYKGAKRKALKAKVEEVRAATGLAMTAPPAVSYWPRGATGGFRGTTPTNGGPGVRVDSGFGVVLNCAPPGAPASSPRLGATGTQLAATAASGTGVAPSQTTIPAASYSATTSGEGPPQKPRVQNVASEMLRTAPRLDLLASRSIQEDQQRRVGCDDNGRMTAEFVEIAKSMRQTTFPTLHAPLRRRMGAASKYTQYHSRD